MNWDALYVAVCIALVVVFILAIAVETPAEREAKEAFWELQEMNVNEVLWRLHYGIKPVMV